MKVAIWLGCAAPLRTIRWLDGALAAAASFADSESRAEGAVAIAAGEGTWLDLAADRATRAGLISVGVPTDLSLDYLGWAQVVAAVVRQLGSTVVLVDEASRPERFPEIAAIAELLDAAQLTHVIALRADGPTLHATRTTGTQLQTLRVRAPAAIGLRIAGPSIEEYPTPMPSASMKRLDLGALGLDATVLGHRGLPPRVSPQPRKTVERIAEHLALHRVPRKGP